LPVATTGGNTFDHFWFQFNSSSGLLDLIYNSQLSQWIQPTGVTVSTYTCPSLITIDARGRISAIASGPCGGGGGGATPAGLSYDLQYNNHGVLAADHNNLTYDPISKTLLTPNVQTSQHRSFYEFQDAKGFKLWLTVPPILNNHRHVSLPNESGELCVKGGSCFGGGAVGISGTPTSGQVAEWTSGTTIQGVSTTGSGTYVRATNPVMTTPNLGTPSAVVLTNATGLPTGALVGTVAIGNLGTSGTPSATTFLRGDNTWQTPAGSGNVSTSGTITTGQAAEWASATTIASVAVTGTGSYVKGTTPTLTSPTIAKIANLTTNGVVTTSGGDGTLGVNTNTLAVENAVQTLTSSATYTCARNGPSTQPVLNQCKMSMTAASATVTFAAPSGTPQDGDRMILRLRCTNAQTIAYNAIFINSLSVIAPVSCPADTTKDTAIGILYSADLTKWQVYASTN